MYCEIKVDSSSNQYKVGTPTKLEHLKGEMGDDLARSPIAYSLSPKLSGGKINLFFSSFCLLKETGMRVFGNTGTYLGSSSVFLPINQYCHVLYLTSIPKLGDTCII